MNPSLVNETYNPDRLIAGDFPRVTREETLISGENLGRGALLGKITASGKYNLSLSAAVDGSQTPVAILAEAIDASAGDKQAPIYETGEFSQDTASGGVIFGTGHTAATVRDALRALGIHLKDPVKP